MKLPWCVAAVLLISAMRMPAQKCEFPSGEAADQLAKSLADAPSCTAAAKHFRVCRWGSAADAGFARPVIQRCERDFLPKLSAPQERNYHDRQKLCRDEYSGQDGSLAISEEAICHLDVAATFSSDPKIADTPLPRASFDCAKAASALEKTVCANPALGRADIVLSNAYKPFLGGLKDPDRGRLIANQRRWLTRTPANCGLKSGQATDKAVACLQKAYKARTDQLDGCSSGMDVDCVDAR